MNDEQQYFVYLHSLPERGVFYIGCGNELRIKSVFRKHNQYHTNILLKYGSNNVTVTVIPCLSRQHAFDLEVAMIASYRKAGANLTNMTEGGEGVLGFVKSPEDNVSPSMDDTKEITLDACDIAAMVKRLVEQELKGRKKSAYSTNPSAVDAKAKMIETIIEKVLLAEAEGITQSNLAKCIRSFSAMTKSNRIELLNQLESDGHLKVNVKFEKTSGRESNRVVHSNYLK